MTAMRSGARRAAMASSALGVKSQRTQAVATFASRSGRIGATMPERVTGMSPSASDFASVSLAASSRRERSMRCTSFVAGSAQLPLLALHSQLPLKQRFSLARKLRTAPR